MKIICDFVKAMNDKKDIESHYAKENSKIKKKNKMILSFSSSIILIFFFAWFFPWLLLEWSLMSLAFWCAATIVLTVFVFMFACDLTGIPYDDISYLYPANVKYYIAVTEPNKTVIDIWIEKGLFCTINIKLEDQNHKITTRKIFSKLKIIPCTNINEKILDLDSNAYYIPYKGEKQ